MPVYIYVWPCPNAPWSVWVCPSMFWLVRACPGVPRAVCACSGMSRARAGPVLMKFPTLRSPSTLYLTPYCLQGKKAHRNYDRCRKVAVDVLSVFSVLIGSISKYIHIFLPHIHNVMWWLSDSSNHFVWWVTYANVGGGPCWPTKGNAEHIWIEDGVRPEETRPSLLHTRSAMCESLIVSVNESNNLSV